MKELLFVQNNSSFLLLHNLSLLNYVKYCIIQEIEFEYLLHGIK